MEREGGREALQFNRPRFHVGGVCLCRIIFEIDGGRGLISSRRMWEEKGREGEFQINGEGGGRNMYALRERERERTGVRVSGGKGNDA